MKAIRVVESRPINGGSNRVVTGAIEISDLVERATVSVRNWAWDKGYQRRCDTRRVKEIADGIKSGQVDLPASFLAGVRAPADRVLEGSGIYLKLNLKPEYHALFIIDAQHRIGALRRLVEEGAHDWGLVSVNFVLDSDEKVETKLFHTANASQRPIGIDLRYDLAKARYEKDPNYRKNCVRLGERWIVLGSRLAEELTKRPGLWKGLIHFPHEPMKGTLIKNGTFVNSLRAVNGTDFFGKDCVDLNRVAIIRAYWEAIRRALPACFIPTEVGRYKVQKSLGLNLMHGLLVNALELVTKGKDTPDAIAAATRAESYSFIEEGLRNLEAETVSGDRVKGADFWLRGKLGPAANYSNNTGYGFLRRRIRKNWPKP